MWYQTLQSRCPKTAPIGSGWIPTKKPSSQIQAPVSLWLLLAKGHFVATYFSVWLKVSKGLGRPLVPRIGGKKLCIPVKWT